MVVRRLSSFYHFYSVLNLLFEPYHTKQSIRLSWSFG
nr:MAG TPA: hypothetical protein [Caudoviricetes sp.]